MPKYEFRCPACSTVFEARRAVDQRHTATCPGCGGRGDYQFAPQAIMIQTPTNLRGVNADFLPDSTPSKSGNYEGGRILAEYDDQILAHREQAAKSTDFETFFRKANPDIDLSKPVQKGERFAPTELTKKYEAAGE